MVFIEFIYSIAEKLPHSIWHLSLLAPSTWRMASRSVLERPRILRIQHDPAVLGVSCEDQPFQKRTFAILEEQLDEGEKDP